MKKILLFCLSLITLSGTVHGQYAQNAVGIGAVDYIEIEANSTLDVVGGFTFEAWILNFGSTSNQKVGGKLVNDFKNGFIFGIENLQVNFEVFDNNGTNTNLLAGNISNIGWTHVAGTYEVGGMMAIFINGVKVAAQPASSVAINPNTNPFRIGIAPWDVNALGFVGYLDEVRYWQTVLDETTIKDWMHKDVTDSHPDYANLSFYHKYNETEGAVAMDETANENWGIFSSEGLELSPQFLAFQGEFDLYKNDVQGVWNAKTEATSDILSITGTFFDSLALANSVLLSHSDGDYSFVTSAPEDYDRSLSKKWRVATQGELFSAVTFDLSPIDMSQVTEVVLLESSDDNFSDASVIEGSLDGDTFSVEEVIFVDGYYYTLGFKTTLTSTTTFTHPDFGVNILPNPNNGAFGIQIKQPQMEESQLRILDLTGKVVYRQAIPPAPIGTTLSVNLGSILAGCYFLEIRKNDQLITQKLVIQ